MNLLTNIVLAVWQFVLAGRFVLVCPTFNTLSVRYRKHTNSKANLPTPTFWHKVLHQ
jgi:hypothetical protein